MKAFALGLLVAAALIGLLLQRVDTEAVGHALAAAAVAPIAFALAAKAVAMVLKARRWALAIGAARGEPVRDGVIAASMVGYAANLVVPARLGEVVRVFVLRRHVPIARVLTLTSAGLAQILDLMFLLLLMVALAVWGATAGVVDSALLAVVTVAVAGLLVGLVLAGVFRARVEPVLRALAARLPEALGDRLVSIFGHASDAIAILRDVRVLGWMTGYTVVVWGLETLAIAAALVGFGIDADAPTAILLMVALNLTFVLPLTPGNLGTHQLVSVLVLGAVGVPEARALAFSLGLQGCVYVMTLVLGGFCFWREGIDLATLRREAG